MPDKLRNAMEGLINIKNNDYKWFLWYHIRHLNTLKIHPERTINADRKMANNIGHVDIKLPVSKKHYSKIEQKNNICINAFSYENDLVYAVYTFQIKKNWRLHRFIIETKWK